MMLSCEVYNLLDSIFLMKPFDTINWSNPIWKCWAPPGGVCRCCQVLWCDCIVFGIAVRRLPKGSMMTAGNCPAACCAYCFFYDLVNMIPTRCGTLTSPQCGAFHSPRKRLGSASCSAIKSTMCVTAFNGDRFMAAQQAAKNGLFFCESAKPPFTAALLDASVTGARGMYWMKLRCVAVRVRP